MYRRFGWVVLVALLTGAASVATAQGRPDEIAVLVNGEPVSTWEIGLLLPQIEGELVAQGQEAKGDIVIRMALQRAIDNQLLAQEAQRQGIEPDEERVAARLDAMAERVGGRAKLEAELMPAGVTYEQLRATVVQADLVQSLVESEVISAVEVSETEVATFFAENPDVFKQPDKIHSRHILFKAGPDASPSDREAARANAVAAHERAVAGEDFAGLAVELSEGPNALKGGDLGFTARGQMVESFDDAVWELAPGEISEVVESELGYHVIKVEEVVIGETVSLEEARPAIESLLRQQKTGEGIGVLVSELRNKAEIRDPKTGD